jgi:hypothetical protein
MLETQATQRRILRPSPNTTTLAHRRACARDNCRRKRAPLKKRIRSGLQWWPRLDVAFNAPSFCIPMLGPISAIAASAAAIEHTTCERSAKRDGGINELRSWRVRGNSAVNVTTDARPDRLGEGAVSRLGSRALRASRPSLAYKPLARGAPLEK